MSQTLKKTPEARSTQEKEEKKKKPQLFLTITKTRQVYLIEPLWRRHGSLNGQ